MIVSQSASPLLLTTIVATTWNILPINGGLIVYEPVDLWYMVYCETRVRTNIHDSQMFQTRVLEGFAFLTILNSGHFSTFVFTNEIQYVYQIDAINWKSL